MDISIYITTQEKICPIVISFLVLQNVNFIITSVFSRRDGILRLGDPRHTYVRKNLREASVKMPVPKNKMVLTESPQHAIIYGY